MFAHMLHWHVYISLIRRPIDKPRAKSMAGLGEFCTKILFATPIYRARTNRACTSTLTELRRES